MVLIYCNLFTPRCKFVFDWIFDQWGIKYTVTRDKDQFLYSESPRIWYDREKFSSDDIVSVFADGMLFEDEIVPKQVKLIKPGGIPEMLFSDSEFDLFSSIFFMLTRYEEYLPYVPDKHGRFPASASVAFKNGLLSIPIVDIWVAQLKLQLKERHPGLSFTPAHFEGILTYDVDIAYKYRGRSVIRQLRSAAKDLFFFDWKNLADRISVLTGFKKDPWDIYNWLRRQADESKLQMLFFVQCGANSAFDKNLSFKTSLMRDLVKKLPEFATVGLHPSYFSMEKPSRIQEERSLLNRMAGREIKLSRQHFLRIRFPETFRELIKSGITRDYSVGYPEIPGFRAGTGKPFYFFDLKENKPTILQLFPVCWMDSTFVNYSHRGASTAYKSAEALIAQTRQTGGVFIATFHNFVLVRDGWNMTHNRIIRLLLKKGTNG